MQIKNLIVTLMFGLFLSILYAQELPPIEIYTPQMYNAENQNWAISQAADKHIYVANNRGLLEFNGANWQLYTSPNETILRSVTAVDDKIYTGCYMEFGFWQRNEFGLLKYTSLSETLNVEMIEDEQIWKIINIDEWIIFQSLQRIYLYNTKDGTYKIIESQDTITAMFLVEDTIMFHRLNKGVFKIENGVDKLVLDSPILKNNQVINVFSSQDGYLIQTADKGFYVLKDNSLQKWETEANQLLAEVTAYSSIQLKDKSFVVGTISQGMIHITPDGKINYKINQTSGLSNNTVLSLFEDIENNIWLGLDNGVNCVNMKSPIIIYKNHEGSLGTVYSSVVFNDYLYLGTNQGLFYRKTKSEDDFKFIEGTKGQVWKLVVYDDTLFCGHNLGTFIVEDNKANLIFDSEGTWDIKPINKAEDELLQGNYYGLNVLKRENGTWRFKNAVEGFENSSRFFEIGSDNTVFVSHEYKGVFKLKINNGLTKAIDVLKVPELPKGLNASLVKYKGDYLYAYKKGVYKYDSSSKTFVKDSLLSSVFTDQNYTTGKQVVDSATDKLWSFGDKYISFITSGKLSDIPEVNKIAIPNALRKTMTGFENITYIENQTYLLGISDGYLLINLKDFNVNDYHISINSVKTGRRDIIENTISLEGNQEFDNAENNIEFTFSVPEFFKYSETKYKYQLKGLYDEWTNWSTNSTAFFENLPYGDYTFNVLAKVGNEELKNSASYKFTINRPWHLSNLMISLYILCLALFSLMMHNIYKRYYRKQREKLMEKSQRELELKQLENEQQRMQFKNETLNKDIESKNRELAISTMSLIKKNEFLNSIKQELNAADDDKKLNSVIKIIDNNLNNTDDWKFFQEAFNNADKDFLKKIKSIHPSLTPNDLKLCAYLRLNLSSKEIAPLLNISVRSVEVKRYRLRKKMNLTHEASLINYILDI